MILTACIHKNSIVGRNWSKHYKVGGVLAGVHFQRAADGNFYAENLQPDQMDALKHAKVDYTLISTGAPLSEIMQDLGKREAPPELVAAVKALVAPPSLTAPASATVPETPRRPNVKVQVHGRR